MSAVQAQRLAFVYDDCRDQPLEALFVPVLSLTAPVQKGDLFIATNCRDAETKALVLQTCKAVTAEGRLVGLMNVEPYCCLVPAGPLPPRPQGGAFVARVMPTPKAGAELKLTAEVSFDSKTGLYTAFLLEIRPVIAVAPSREEVLQRLFGALDRLLTLNRDELTAEPVEANAERIDLVFTRSVDNTPAL